MSLSITKLNELPWTLGVLNGDAATILILLGSHFRQSYEERMRDKYSHFQDQSRAIKISRYSLIMSHTLTNFL
ncbi:hypothetical protein Hanom_Chr01g00021551 [Helianthus anomalus]